MKKRVNRSLVLLAMCMQSMPGKIITVEQVTMAEAYVKPVEKNNTTGRLLRIHTNLQVANLTDKQVQVVYENLDDLQDLNEDRDERLFKNKTTQEKKKHIENKVLEVTALLKNKPLSKSEQQKASKYLSAIENIVQGSMQRNSK